MNEIPFFEFVIVPVIGCLIWVIKTQFSLFQSHQIMFKEMQEHDQTNHKETRNLIREQNHIMNKLLSFLENAKKH